MRRPHAKFADASANRFQSNVLWVQGFGGEGTPGAHVSGDQRLPSVQSCIFDHVLIGPAKAMLELYFRNVWEFYYEHVDYSHGEDAPWQVSYFQQHQDQSRFRGVSPFRGWLHKWFTPECVLGATMSQHGHPRSLLPVAGHL